MGKCVSIIASFIIRLWCSIYSYNTSNWFKNKRNVIYSLWISNFLGSMGKGSFISYPCKLWGGGSKNIKIGDSTTIQSHCIFGTWIKYAGEQFTPSITIGDCCNIGEHTHISSINKITIGNGLLTGRYVYIGDNSHGGFNDEECQIPPIKRQLKSKGEVVIEDNVWIGDKVTVLSGVRIGKGSIIGANSVVTKDVPPFTIVAGVPARIIKQIEICQNQEL